MEKYFDIKDKNKTIKCKIYYNNKENVDSVILSCHGFTGSKDNKTAKALADYVLEKYNNIAIMSFDLPGHGDDSIELLDLDICDEYFETVINYLKNKLGIRNIYSQGTSFGGYLTLKYISEHGNPFNKIALRCPAVNMYDALTDIILTDEEISLLESGKSIGLGDDKKINFNSYFVNQLRNNNILERDYSNYSDDIIVFHGDNDTLIDFNVDRLFCSKNNIKFVPVRGADHGFNKIEDLEKCVRDMSDFYNIEFVDKKKNNK